jgi:hypothetical protein
MESLLLHSPLWRGFRGGPLTTGNEWLEFEAVPFVSNRALTNTGNFIAFKFGFGLGMPDLPMLLDPIGVSQPPSKYSLARCEA